MKKKAKQNKSWNSVMREAVFYVREHEYLPDNLKDLAEASVRHQFQVMGEMIANLELAYRRTREVKE